MGSKRRKLLIGSYLSLMLGVFAVWSPALAETKIGVIATLTGPFARYGAKVQAAVSAVKSDSVSMVFENEGCEPKVAVSAFKKLSEVDRVRLFIGPGCGSPQSAIAPLLSRGGQLAVLGSSAPRGLFRQSDGRMFSTQPSIEDESTFLGNQLSERGVNSVVIVFSENGFSRAHEAAFRASYRGKILETFAYTSDAPAELKSIALKIKQLNAEALYVPDGFPLLRGFGRELRAIGAERPIYSVYSAQSKDVLRGMGADAERMIYSYPDIGSEDALTYFPTLAAKILVEAAQECGDDVACVKSRIMTRHKFDQYGTLEGQLILKTVREGSFVALADE